MKFDVITIFPEIFKSFLETSLISRALKKRIIFVKTHDLRRWTKDNHKTVDGRPYGGGAGMVMMVEPIMRAVADLKKTGSKKSRVILFSAKGKRFTQDDARRLSKYKQLIFICGRYEGIDERVADHIADEEISIGDYVLFGGEVPAMVIIEAVARLIPGVVQKEESIINESFSDKEAKIKEYAQYTRPETIIIGGKKRSVPKVLLSGNHKKIEEWRRSGAK